MRDKIINIHNIHRNSFIWHAKIKCSVTGVTNDADDMKDVSSDSGDSFVGTVYDISGLLCTCPHLEVR